jgi:valyl-tRNA synthetase
VTNENRELIENLATCTIKQVAMALPQPPNAVRATVNNCDVYVEDLINPAAESARTAKRKEELLKEQSTLQARLSNEGYIARAPAKLVQQTKDRLAEIETELKKLR